MKIEIKTFSAQEVIDKIGKDEDVLSYVTGKLCFMLILSMALSASLIMSLFDAFLARDTVKVISFACLIIIIIVFIIENIFELNKLEKTRIQK